MADLDSRWQAFTGNDEDLPQDLPAAEFKKILKALGQDFKEPTQSSQKSSQNETPFDFNKKKDSIVIDPKKVQTSSNDSSKEYQLLEQEIARLKEEKESLEKELALSRKTSEEISRLALKEANHLLTKAKQNADMILRESMEYVNGLTTNIEDYKKEAIDFRSKVVKLSDEVLDTIDSSELFSLIKEENAKKENGSNNNF